MIVLFWFVMPFNSLVSCRMCSKMIVSFWFVMALILWLGYVVRSPKMIVSFWFVVALIPWFGSVVWSSKKIVYSRRFRYIPSFRAQRGLAHRAEFKIRKLLYVFSRLAMTPWHCPPSFMGSAMLSEPYLGAMPT